MITAMLGSFIVGTTIGFYGIENDWSLPKTMFIAAVSSIPVSTTVILFNLP